MDGFPFAAELSKSVADLPESAPALPEDELYVPAPKQSL
jgi:hypothetical protein